MKGALKSTTMAPGAPCVTTCGASMLPTWCAGSWAAGRASAPRGAATSGRVWGASSWTTCSARALRPHWAGASIWACLSTTVATRRTPASSAQVLTLDFLLKLTELWLLARDPEADVGVFGSFREAPIAPWRSILSPGQLINNGTSFSLGHPQVPQSHSLPGLGSRWPLCHA